MARIPRSLLRFLVTGSLTVGVDAVAYALLLQLHVPVNWAKGIGLLCATAFAYVVNKYWTFSDAPAERSRVVPFLLLYASAILLNVIVNRSALMVVGQSREGFIAAWFLATAASSTWNYLGLRFFVFRAAP